MFKRESKKYKLIIIFTMLIACVVTTILSLRKSKADEYAGLINDSIDMAEGDSGSGGKTNIDKIIDIVNAADDPETPLVDNYYYIVEISSGAASSLANFCEDTDADGNPIPGKFYDLVIDGNKTDNQTLSMPAGRIRYTYFTPAQLVADIEGAQKTIASADLLYLRYDTNTPFSASNDLPEAIKTQLDSFASGEYKPLIIDNPAVNEQQKGDVNTFTTLFDTVKKSSPRKAYGWDTSDTAIANAGNFFGMAGSSKYLPFNSDMSNWTSVFNNDPEAVPGKDDEGNDVPYYEPAITTFSDGTQRPVYIARILTITANASNTTLTNKILEGTTSTTANLDKERKELTITDPDTGDETKIEKVTDVETKSVYKVESSNYIYRAYKVRTTHPDYVENDVLVYNQADADSTLASVDLSNYDMVIFESSLKSIPLKNDAALGQDDYSALYGAFNGGLPMVYDDSISSGSSGGGSTKKIEALNYGYVYGKLTTATQNSDLTYTASTNDKSKYKNVLVTNTKKMVAYTSAPFPAAEKDIVDIINNGTFRGMGGGNGDASNKYNVLEIQPCYPIDTYMADRLGKFKGKYGYKTGDLKDVAYDGGFYYMITDGVLNNVTTDEITYDGENALSYTYNVANDFQTLLNLDTDGSNISKINYYAWEMSPAKVLHILKQTTPDKGFSDYTLNQVNVDHMSLLEFTSSRNTLLENYDMIYIGGNTSAIKSNMFFKIYEPQNGTESGNHSQMSYPEIVNFKGGTYYRMFYHNGEWMKYTKGSEEFSNIVSLQTGNDLTATRLAELEEYMSSGMPIVVSSEAVRGYDNAVANGNNQHDVDPESRMFRYLAELEGAKDTLPNVVWDFDYEDTIMIPNEGGEYGETVSGFVTVFNGADTGDYFGNTYTPDGTVGAMRIANAISNSNYRPKFSLTKAPMPYNEYDSSTWIDKKSISFDVEVSSLVTTGVTNASLYIDLDGDGKFTGDDERLQGPLPIGSNGKITITQNLSDDFYGGLYWKVEVSNGSAKAATVGICKIKKATTDPKTIVNVLQIFPYTGEYNTSLNTLYFCTECQRFRKVFDANVTEGRDGSTKYGTNSHMSKADSVNAAVTGDYFGLKKPDLKKVGDEYNKYTLGLHHHNFGIVKYGTNNDMPEWDDWSSNWADALIDEYDFNLNLMTTAQFDAKITEIVNAYSGLTDEQKSNDRETYRGNAEVFYNYYLCMKYLINGDIKVSLGTDGTLSLVSGFGQIGETQFNSFVKYMNDELDVNGAKLLDYSKAQGDLDKQIDNAIASTRANHRFGRVESDISEETIIKDLEYVKRYHIYYDFYSFFISNDQNDTVARNYSTYYAPWRDAKIYEQYMYDNWLKNKEFASYNENGEVDFSGIYDTIVIGAAEKNRDASFNKDMTQQACQALVTYNNAEGHLFLLHDTLSVDTPNMTATLREIFGQDARHMKVSKAGGSFTPKDNVFRITVGDNTVDYTMPFGDIDTTLTFRQSSKAYTTDRNIDVDIDGTTRQVKISPTAQTLNVNVKRTAKGGTINALVKCEGKDWNSHTFSLDTSKAKAVIHIKHNNAHHYPGINWNDCTVTYENSSSGSGFEIELVSELNDTWHVPGTNFTINVGDTEATVDMSSYRGSVSIPKDYEFTVTTSTSGTVSGNSDQDIVVNVTDGSNAPINGLNVTIGSDKKQTVNGKATFTTKNYSDNYFEQVVKAVNGSNTTTGSDNAKLKILAVTADAGYNGIAGVPVKVVNQTSGNTYQGYTNAQGEFNDVNDVINYTAIAGGSYVPQYIYTGSYANGGENEYSQGKYKISQLSKTGAINFDFTATALTTRMGMPDSGSNSTLASFMTKYSIYSHEPESVQCQDGQFDHKNFNEAGKMCTDRATQVNRGLVTMYPFTIGETLNISGTHAQTFSVDMEDIDMTVWYSLAGGVNGSMSSYLAASPNDGQNNYFIYSYGNVTYCGVGHGSVTGKHAANNDERRLLINVIVNNSKKAAIGTSVNLYDAESTQDSLKNEKIIPKSDGSYQMTVSGDTQYPNFSFLASTDTKSGSTIKRVHVYYDLDLNDGEDPHTYDFGTANGNHILIYDTGVMNASKSRDFNGVLRYVDNNKPDGPDSDYYVKNSIGEFNLKLNPNYMRDHNGQKYTYIIVCVTTTSKSGVDSTIYKKIKLVPIPVMYDLN